MGRAAIIVTLIISLTSFAIGADPASPARQRSVAKMNVGQRKSVVRDLTQMLHHPDPATRNRAAIALGRLGNEASTALEDLVAALEDSEEHVRFAAEWSIVQISQGIEQFGALGPATLQEECLRQLEIAAEKLEQQRVVGRDMSVVLRAKHRIESSLTRRDSRTPVSISPPKVVARPPAEVPVGESVSVIPPQGSVSVTHGGAGAPRVADPALVNRLRNVLEGSDSVAIIAEIEALGKLGMAGAPLLVAALDFDAIEPAAMNHVQTKLTTLGVDVVPLIVPLLGKRPATRDAATDVFETMGPKARLAVPSIVQLLRKTNDLELRRKLVRTLQAIGPGAGEAVPLLVEIASRRTENSLLRHEAIEAVHEIGANTIAIHQEFFRILQDDHCECGLRVAAANWLSSHDGVAKNVYAELERMLQIACKSESQTTEPPESVANAWERNLHLIHVVEAIGKLEKEATGAIRYVLPLLEHEDDGVRCAAGQSLVAICGQTPESENREVVNAIIDQIHREESTDTRTSLANSLCKLGPIAIKQLADGIKSTDEKIKEHCIEAVGVLGERASCAVSYLSDVIDDDLSEADEDAILRAISAAKALGAIGRVASDSTNSLVARCCDHGTDFGVRIECLRALRQIGPTANLANAPLSELARDRRLDGQLRAEAILALGAVHPNITGSPESASEIEAALDDADVRVRVAAAQAISLSNPTHLRVAPTLIQGLVAPEAQAVANYALVKMGAAAIPFLETVACDTTADCDLRLEAIHTLSEIGEPATASLIHILECDEAVVGAASEALFSIGESILPQLVAAIEKEQNAATQGAPVAANAEDNREFGDSPERPPLSPGSSAAIGSSAPPAPIPAGSAQTSKKSPAPSKRPPQSASASTKLDNYRRPLEFMFADGLGAADDSETDSIPAFGETAQVTERKASQIGEGQRIAASGADEEQESTSNVDRVVRVFYGTNRAPLSSALERLQLERMAFLPAIVVLTATILFAVIAILAVRKTTAVVIGVIGLVITSALAYPALTRVIRIEQSAGRPGPVYGTEYSDDIAMGSCDVTIPVNHRDGELETNSWIRLEFKRDPFRHICVKSVTRSDRVHFFADLKRDMAKEGQSVLVFVHGYNVDFDDAARRTAQMKHDLDFPGAAVFFSWPSQGNWYQYRVDEQQVDLAVNQLKLFLLDIVRSSGADSIHLVAHSMGTRALTAALKEIHEESEEHETLFQQVVLAAPDIDAEIFRHRIAPAIQDSSERITLYASSNDLALVASRTFNSGTPRAGDTSHGVLVVNGIETIDVSSIDTSLLGHSYYGNNPTVLTDLKDLLHSEHPASQRSMLEPVATNGKRYWAFRQDTSTARGSFPGLPRL